MFVQHTLLNEVKRPQVGHTNIERIKVNIKKSKSIGFVEDEQGTIRFQNRICVPQSTDLREKIMSGAHNTKYSMDPGGTKMYRDLRQTFWWSNMKRDMAEFVDKCLTY